MKKLLCLLFAACLLCAAALAEDFEGFDYGPLEADETLIAYPDDNRIDFVYRSETQPFSGELSEGTVLSFLDFVDLADAGVVVLRFAFAVQTDALLYATDITLSCGSAVMVRSVMPITTEYDSIYMEDYYIPVTGDGFDLIRALLSGGGELQVQFQSEERTVTGTVHIPVDELRRLWETYEACGGTRQDLERLGD